MRARLGIVVAVSLLVFACGEDGDDAQAADALASVLAADTTLAGYGVGVPEAECTADAVVDALGAERIDAVAAAVAGGEPTLATELDDAETEALAAALDECFEASPVDVRDNLADAVAAGVLASATDDFPVERDEADCIGASVVDDLGVPAMLTLGIDGIDGGDGALDDDRADAFIDAFLTCTDVRARVLAGVGAGDVDDEVLACLDVAITDEQVAELFALGFADDAASEARAAEVLAPAIEFCTS